MSDNFSQETDFKTVSQDELNILDLLNSVNQLDAYNLRQIFLLLVRNYYANPRAFNADGIVLPESYYKYTYSDNIVDPDRLVDPTVRIELGYSSAENSIDKTDYLDNNQKPAIYLDLGDFEYEPTPVINQYTDRFGDIEEKAMLCKVPIVFSHYANTYDDAAKMSSLTNNYFIGMKDYIRHSLKAISFLPAGLETPKPQINNYTDSAQKYFLARAKFLLTFEANWRVKQEAVLIKKFTIKLNAVSGISNKKQELT